MFGWKRTEDNKDDAMLAPWERKGGTVPPAFPILYKEQPGYETHAGINYHYPPAQAEHGRWYNNVAYGNAIPNSMLQSSRAISGVYQLPWQIQYNKEIIPFQLKNTVYPYGGTNSMMNSANLLQQASSVIGQIFNSQGNNK